VAYDLFRSFGGAADPRYSPKIRLVEVFVNDEYQGVYQLSERVDRHMFPLTVNGEAVIYKAVSKHDVFATLRTDAFVQVEPPADRSAHWEPLAELTRFTSQPRGRVFAEGIGQRIDLPTFADYLILVNLMNHNEGELHNFLLVRAAETEDRFVIVPWDFDKSLGEAHERWRSNFLFDRLLQRVPEFKTMLKTRWVELRRAQLDGAALDARVDWLAQELEASVPREFERWPRAGMPTHRQAIAETKTRLRQRLLFLDRHLARL
jgi:spore coat protein H